MQQATTFPTSRSTRRPPRAPRPSSHGAERANPILEALVRAVHSIHGRTSDPLRLAHEAASTLRLFLGHPQLLRPEQRASAADRYRQHILYVAPDGAFSIVALVWRPGQATSIHDHLSWCAIGVHQGCEEEIGYDLTEVRGAPCLVPKDRQRFDTGSTTALVPPGDIHQVTNPGPGEAISIHVYGADVHQLGSSIRQAYDLPIAE
jgi:3-mercaptopropionate dioxygenase